MPAIVARETNVVVLASCLWSHNHLWDVAADMKVYVLHAKYVSVEFVWSTAWPKEPVKHLTAQEQLRLAGHPGQAEVQHRRR